MPSVDPCGEKTITYCGWTKSSLGTGTMIPLQIPANNGFSWFQMVSMRCMSSSIHSIAKEHVCGCAMVKTPVHGDYSTSTLSWLSQSSNMCGPEIRNGSQALNQGAGDHSGPFDHNTCVYCITPRCNCPCFSMLVDIGLVTNRWLE